MIDPRGFGQNKFMTYATKQVLVIQGAFDLCATTFPGAFDVCATTV
jgi:hypothetical protein